MPDKTINCQDCGQEFVWTQGEQDFYEQKGLKSPKLCPICRGKQQAKQAQFAKYKKSK